MRWLPASELGTQVDNSPYSTLTKVSSRQIHSHTILHTLNILCTLLGPRSTNTARGSVSARSFNRKVCFESLQISNSTRLENAYKYCHMDTNEPAVFSGLEVTMPKENLHYGNWEHRDLHSLNGRTFVNATYHALLNRKPGKPIRPFVLTRSFYAGSQRIGAVWTGENQAQWDHLEASLSMILSLNIAGFSNRALLEGSLERQIVSFLPVGFKPGPPILFTTISTIPWIGGA